MKTSYCDGGIQELELPKGDVQYPFARIEDGRIISISNITIENKKLHKYTCPGCKEEFRPRLGSKRAHCFYHFTGNRCDIDKYIHNTAELVLKQKFDNEEKFEIVMSVHEECRIIKDCLFRTETCASDNKRTFDLKEHFKECLIERRYGEFIPDLLLLPKEESKEPIFIEIWNKHKNSEKKANSSYMIIEVKIQSLPELEELPKYPLTESDTVTFSHFRKKLQQPEKMAKHVELMRYTLFQRGTSFCNKDDKCKCYSYKTIPNKSAVFIAIGRQMDFENDPIHDTPRGAMREFATYMARKNGYEPKSCYDCIMCKQENTINGSDSSSSSLFCRKKRFTTGDIVKCKQEDALTCDSFSPKNYNTNEVLDRHKEDPIYIWEREQKTSE